MYLYKRGNGAKRRVVHLAIHDQRSGEPTFRAWCGRLGFNTTCNLPLGLKVCKRCIGAGL
jgi:hypothetical protein